MKKFDNRNSKSRKNNEDRNNKRLKDKKKRSSMECESDEVRTSKTNDASWYTKSTALLNSAANLPYGYPLGSSLKLGPIDFTTGHLPGVCTLWTITGPGRALDINAPVNVAGKDIYSFVRHANSGHANYDSNDLLVYMLAADEAYMLFYQAVRVFGAVNLFNNENRYGPSGIVAALGWSYNDVMKNLAKFRYAINAMAVKLNSLAVPATWPLFQRHAWLYSGLYVDGTSPKAQMYAIAPVLYRVRDDKTGNLVAYSFATGQPFEAGKPILHPTGITVDKWITAMDSCLNALLSSEDVGIISGDILKAYGPSGLVVTNPIPTDYTIAPIYDEEVLSQIQNASFFTGAADVDIKTDNSIYAGGIIKYDPRVHVRNPIGIVGNCNIHDLYKMYPLLNWMLTLNLNEPKPADTMVASRLSSIMVPYPTKWSGSAWSSMTGADTANMFVEFDTMGTEFVSQVSVLCFGADDKAYYHDVDPYQLSLWSGNAITKADDPRILTMMSKFKYHPRVFTLAFTNDTPSATAVPTVQGDVLLEVDNFTILDSGTLGQLNSCAILSEFDVPTAYKG